jgi:hypothetical protein
MLPSMLVFTRYVSAKRKELLFQVPAPLGDSDACSDACQEPFPTGQITGAMVCSDRLAGNLHISDDTAGSPGKLGEVDYQYFSPWGQTCNGVLDSRL